MGLSEGFQDGEIFFALSRWGQAIPVVLKEGGGPSEVHNAIQQGSTET